ncbi:MAG: CDP-alcohol phosphatidyltransferase family protein [Candidatus Omnitrophica bacterium]|nr:CDP-alcohol phosphatidyltransferase family protein [Candidatus Omnitrophota bacterium]
MNFANKISTFRILSAPFFIATIVYYSSSRDYLRFVALGIFILAVISDAVDGYIARISKQESPAGLILDPLGDKLLLMSAFICLSSNKFNVNFPLWFILLVISRDVIIILGAVVIFIVKQKIDIAPTRWGKLTTAFQMASVIVVLLQLKFSFIFWWLAAFFTFISGIDYIMRGFEILYAVDNHRNSH